jgi:hypothetical protein
MTAALFRAGCPRLTSSPVVITTGIRRFDKISKRGLAFPSATYRSTTAASNGMPSFRALCAPTMELAILTTAAPASRRQDSALMLSRSVKRPLAYLGDVR